MFPKTSRALAFCGVLAIAGSPAQGQIPLGNGCCPIPIPQPCYQTVPVTEIRECRQTVQRPVVETTYVDQPVTQFRQVVENQTAVVPTVCYQNVAGCQTVQRDCGHWITQYQCRPQMTPCQYDNRPDLFGFLNRSGYSLRMAFTPKVYAQRTYVPNIVTQTIPTMRQVAVHGTRTVNYQVARMVPYTTTRRVAVNTVRMVAQEVVTRHPVTVLRTVPTGAGLAYGAYGPGGGVAYGYGPVGGPMYGYGQPMGGPAYGYGHPPAYGYAQPPAYGYGQSMDSRRQATLQPSPDPKMSDRREATLRPPADPFPSANRPLTDSIKVTPKAPTALPEALSDEADEIPLNKSPVPIKKSSLSRPGRTAPSQNDEPSTAGDQDADGADSLEPQVASTPSAVRVGRWVARRTPRPSGPSFPETMVSVAGTKKARR